jgi:hypothetical protein
MISELCDEKAIACAGFEHHVLRPDVGEQHRERRDIGGR